MNLLFVQEAKYAVFDKIVYSPRIEYHSYWERYLNHFKKVSVLARVEKVERKPVGQNVSSGPNVEFIALPMFDGPVGLLSKRSSIKKVMRKVIEKDAAVILRIPGHLGVIASEILKSKAIPFSCELVGDPLEVSKFLPYPKLFRSIYGFSMFRNTKRLIADAIAVLYVTRYSLQKKYPSSKLSIVSSASNVILPDEMIKNSPKKLEINYIDRLSDKRKKAIRIGVVGMLYDIKSPKDIMYSISKLIQLGLNVELYFAGDGPLYNELIALRKKLNLVEEVVFLGNLKGGKEVFEFLDSINLFVQFSKTEGLPRSTIEAMARGCPIIASDVGGQSELLTSEYLVESGNVEILTKKINTLLSDPNRMLEASKVNIENSKKYSLSVLKKIRYEHYSRLVDHLRN